MELLELEYIQLQVGFFELETVNKHNNIKGFGIIRNLVIYFFVANDGLSVIENVGKMNIPIPKKLKDALIQLSEEKEDTKDD